MVISLSYQALHFFDYRNAHKSMSSSPKKTVTTNSHQYKFHFERLELFGATPSNEAAPQQTEKLPETNLQLTLKGISSSNDNGKEASAIVEDSSKKTLTYKIGDRLPGGAKIVAIYTKRIVIERSGKKENLLFPEDKAIGINQDLPTQYQSTVPIPSPQSLGYSDSASAAIQREASGLDNLSEERKKTIRARLEKIRQKMDVNP
jgi:general secretion pathway protein C